MKYALSILSQKTDCSNNLVSTTHKVVVVVAKSIEELIETEYSIIEKEFSVKDGWKNNIIFLEIE